MIRTYLGYIVAQVDDHAFQTRFYATDLIVTSYLSHELYYRNIRPLVGDLIKLEYNSGLRRKERRLLRIVDILYSKNTEQIFNKMAIPITRGLATLRQLNLHYYSLEIELFFGSKLGELLYSTLGFKTIQDLVNVEALTLVKAVSQFSYIAKEEFFRIFEDLVEFFLGSDPDR